VDWHGAFKSLCEVVRIKIQCKNMFAIPKTAVFKLNKKFYKIGIVVEFPAENGGEGDEPQEPDDPNGKNSEDSQGKEEMETENASKDHQNSKKGTSGSKEPPSDTSNNKNRKADADTPVPIAKDSEDEALSMSDMLPANLENARRDILSWLNSDTPDEEKCYNLLREMEVVNDDGHFVYDGMEEDVVSEQHIEDPLPEIASETAVGQKDKIWGPVAGARQCPRLQKNVGKPILDLAKDIKMKKNLEIPSKFQGTSSNPFNVLQDNSLISMAHSFRVDIDSHQFSSPDSVDFNLASKIDEVTFIPSNLATVGNPSHQLSVDVTEGMSAGHSPSVTPTAISSCSDSPKTPVCSNLDLELDSEELWTKVCRNRRGKHPRKIVYL
jgi:hypothetical protein